MDQLNGKVAVVTGAASGIGYCTAALLARQGMKVVLADVNEAQLNDAVAKIKAEGGEAIGVKTNVGDFESVKNLAEVTYSTFGAAHIVHLNAGISTGSSLFDDEIDSWRRITDINYLGVVWGIKAFVNRMIEGGEEGLILATSSGAGAEGTSYYTPAYASGKMAVVSLLECLHGQLRDRQSKVRAGLVFPPLTATRLAGDDPQVLAGTEAYLQSRGVPAKLVVPEKVAEMVLDGIRRGRFFIGADSRTSAEFYEGAMTPEFFEWNARMIRGRAEAQLNDGKPDAYLW
jgi:NAD(P)-dependent dehydrogenase (short-subunit alcohol dehydrogenase family)